MTDIGDHISNNSIAFDMYNRFRSYVKVEEDVCAFFERSFLARRGWRAVVVSEELSPDEAKAVASACRRFGYDTATALDIDHFDSGFFYQIRLAAESLSMLEETFITPSYLVVEQKERFMLVSDSDYYWSIAAAPDFLKMCFKKSLDAIDREFIEATRNYRSGASRIGHSLARIAAEAIGGPVLTG